MENIGEKNKQINHVKPIQKIVVLPSAYTTVLYAYCVMCILVCTVCIN